MVLCADKEAANTCMEARPVTPDTGAQPGEVSPADGPGPGELLRYRSAQGRRGVAAMSLGAAGGGVGSTGGPRPRPTNGPDPPRRMHRHQRNTHADPPA